MITAISLLFFSLWGSSTPKALDPDDIPASGKVWVLIRPDTLMNCDTTSRVKRIFEAETSAKTDDDSGFPLLKADSMAVQQLTFLNRSGDSLFFMARVKQDSANFFSTSLCVVKQNIARVSLLKAMDSDDDAPKEKKSGHRHRKGT